MSDSKNESIAAEVIAASVGGAVSASALYPLEVLKTKLQAANSTTTKTNEAADDDDKGENDSNELSPIPYARRMYQEGGIGVFYQGVGTSAIQSAAEKALYFFAYTALKNIYRAVTGMNTGTISSLILGAAAEWAHLPVTLPIDCLTTKIQTDNPHGASAMTLLTTMLSEKGWAGMYKGIQAYQVLCLKPAIQYTVFEQVKKSLLLVKKNDSSGSLNSMEAFLLGMVARAVATVVTFPYVRAKVIAQSSKSFSNNNGSDSDGAEEEEKSIPQVIAGLRQKGGLSELFQGLGPELTRGVLSAAFMMMVKERIAAIVYAMVVPTTTSSRNKIRKPL